MNFRYYYRITEDHKPVWNEVGHIKIPNKNKSPAFFCGTDKFDKYEIREWSLPGRELCPQCVQERNRLIDGRPTSYQVQTWWQGGQEAHKKELESIL